jgi:hypothetical protein
MLPLLNPHPPTEQEATGFIAPYIRIATHLGFVIAWVDAMTQEEWENTEAQLNTKQDILDELREARQHLIHNEFLSATAYVKEDTVSLMKTLETQFTELIELLQTTTARMVAGSNMRSDTILNLKVLANNIAYAGAQLERSFTGSTASSEGVNV